MDIIKSTKIAFAYTVKTLTSNNDYQVFFDKLSKLSVKVEYKISELDSKGKLHYHGILYLDKGFYRKRICVSGFHVKLVELHDRVGWLKYIHKDVKSETEAEAEYEDYLFAEKQNHEYPPPLKRKLF